VVLVAVALALALALAVDSVTEICTVVAGLAVVKV